MPPARKTKSLKKAENESSDSEDAFSGSDDKGSSSDSSSENEKRRKKAKKSSKKSKNSKAGPASRKRKNESSSDEESSDDENDKKKKSSKKAQIAKKKFKHEFPSEFTIVPYTDEEMKNMKHKIHKCKLGKRRNWSSQFENYAHDIWKILFYFCDVFYCKVDLTNFRSRAHACDAQCGKVL